MRHERTPYLWTLPAVAALAALSILPLGWTLWLSLHHRVPVFGINDWVGGANYAHLFRNPRFLHSVGVTLYFTALSVVLELAIGMAMALLLWREFKRQALVMGALLVPWILPSLAAAKMWEWIFNPKFGVLNHLLVSWGVLAEPRVWLGSPWWAIHAAILTDLWKTAPFMALLILAGLRSIPAELYRAAEVDGAGTWQTFWRVTLPSLKPMLVVAVLFRALEAFRVFDVVYVLTGGGPADTTETLSIYAYKVLFGTLNFGYGSAIGFLIFAGAALISASFLFFMRDRRAAPVR